MADTVINTLYPPLIETFQPSFVYDKHAIITFSLSPFNTINDIQSIHVSVVDQRNNTNVLQTSKNPDRQLQNEDGEYTQYYYGITNGILIAEMPKFDYNSQDIQKNGLLWYDPINNLYAISIAPNLLSNRADDGYWNNNQYYQIQIRFDSCNAELWHNNGVVGKDFIKYMLDKREYFSEWSSVTLIKPILEPIISIAQFNNNNSVSTYPGLFHINGCIAFDTTITKDGISIPETERLQMYQIQVKTSDNEIIYDSDWIYARQNLGNDSITTIDCLIDLGINRQPDEVLTIIVYCKTNNGYQCSQNYSIVIKEYGTLLSDIKWNNFSNKTIALMFVDTLPKTDIRYNNIISDLSEEKYTNIITHRMTSDERQKYYNIIEVNQEDGVGIINFSATANSTGTLYFKRASSQDNFKTWDIIYQYQYDNQNSPLEVPFQDFTIGSLYKYKYSVQMCVTTEDNKEQWSNIYTSAAFYAKFYEMLLMRQNQQIAIRYNGQVSSWKPTINRQKIDTLGGRYPKFVENAAMNYKTYQISGLISAEADFNRKFLSELKDINVQYYDTEFNTEYLIRNDTAADGEKYYSTINTKKQVPFSSKYPYKENTQDKEAILLNNQHDSYPHNHWYWEREFREQLVAWLNDGEPKLYRSMPEGNIAVMLTDINLTPESQLGRMLYNFSATMYEVGNGYSLDELEKLKIINIPKFDNTFLVASRFNDVDEDETSGRIVTRIGQTAISSVGQVTDWINGNFITSNVPSDLWNNMPIQEQLQEYYNGKINESEDIFDIVPNSIKLKNLAIQFNTPPQYFNYNKNNEEGFKFTTTTDETEWLGYVINIKTDAKSQNFQQIFINQRGYYVIPNSVNVQNISILSSGIKQEANLLYECQYKLRTAAENAIIDKDKEKEIIGQYTNDTIPLNTDIINLIYQDYEKIIYDNGAYYRWYLEKCKGLLLDLTPYTYIKYIYKNDNDDLQEGFLTIGQTGIFNAFEDWVLESLYILGRRMIIINPNDTLDTVNKIPYPYHIEEWQCYKDIDGDITNPKINGIYIKDNIWQIYYIDGHWYPIDIQPSTQIAIAEVPIYGMINYHGDLVKEIH